MLRVTATLMVGLLAVSGKADTVRRLQVEEQLLRRRNVWDDIEDAFVEVGDWIVTDVWEPIEGWSGWDDFANAMIDIGDFFAQEAWEEETWEEFGEWTADEFTKGWNDVTEGLDDAWQWVKGAGETIGDSFVTLGCMVDEWTTGTSCTKCVKDACNDHLSDETIEKIDNANNVALMDMDEEFEPLIEGCASTLEMCPAVSDCQELYNLPASTQAFVADTIARCNLCYQCLPYGSTNEGCQKALDDVFPSTCEGCTVNQQNMYKMFYTCSSIETIVVSIGQLGEAYAPGADAYINIDQTCRYCENCSGYQTELVKTCTDWANIKHNWDRKGPVVPDSLCFKEEGCPPPTKEVNAVAPTPIPTPSPTPSPTQSPTQKPTLAGSTYHGTDPAGWRRSGGRPGRGRRLRL